MGWNEPGKNLDPWGRPKKSSFDLVALIKKYKHKWLATLNKQGSSKHNNPKIKQSGWLLSFFILVASLIWLLSGLFIVDSNEQIVVTRFGNYATTLGPGLRWLPRFIEQGILVNQSENSFTYQNDLLTLDQKLVSVAVTVNFRIVNPYDYVFTMNQPNLVLEQASASVISQIINAQNFAVDFALKQQKLQEQLRDQLQTTLNRYRMGIQVTNVTVDSLKPPTDIGTLVNKLVNAQQERQVMHDKANLAAKQVVTAAQQQAASIIQQAQAAKQETVLAAQTDTADFLALLPAYQKSPASVRNWLYFNSMQTILHNTTKVLVEGNNQIVLPLDKILSATNLQKPASIKKRMAKSAAFKQDATDQNVLTDRPSYPIRGDD